MNTLDLKPFQLHNLKKLELDFGYDRLGKCLITSADIGMGSSTKVDD